MKKLLTLLMFLGIGGFFILSGSSCTHEYTCRCIMTYTGQPGLPDSTIRDYPIKDTRKKAIDLCSGNSQVYHDGTITTTEVCHLL